MYYTSFAYPSNPSESFSDKQFSIYPLLKLKISKASSAASKFRLSSLHKRTYSKSTLPPKRLKPWPG